MFWHVLKNSNTRSACLASGARKPGTCCPSPYPLALSPSSTTTKLGPLSFSSNPAPSTAGRPSSSTPLPSSSSTLTYATSSCKLSNLGSLSRSTCGMTPSLQSNWTLWQHAPNPGSSKTTPPGAGWGPPPPAALSASHRPLTTTCNLSLTPKNVPGPPRVIHRAEQSSAGITGLRPAASARRTTLATAAPYKDVASVASAESTPALNPATARAPPRSSSVCSPCSERLRKASLPYCHHPSDLNVVCFAKPPTKCATATRGG